VTNARPGDELDHRKRAYRSRPREIDEPEHPRGGRPPRKSPQRAQDRRRTRHPSALVHDRHYCGEKTLLLATIREPTRGRASAVETSISIPCRARSVELSMSRARSGRPVSSGSPELRQHTSDQFKPDRSRSAAPVAGWRRRPRRSGGRRRLLLSRLNPGQRSTRPGVDRHSSRRASDVHIRLTVDG